MTGKSRKRACVFYNFDSVGVQRTTRPSLYTDASITTMKKLLAIISLWRYNMAMVLDLCDLYPVLHEADVAKAAEVLEALYRQFIRRRT